MFEAGLFGGASACADLHPPCERLELPTDLLGLTCVRYGEATTPAEMRVVNQKLRKAIENEGRIARIEGLWWQFSLTERTAREPSAVSLLRIARDRDGALELTGRAWQEDGRLSARYWSEAMKERKEPSGLFYYWKENGPWTRTRRSWTGRGISGRNPRIAHLGTSRRMRTRNRAERATAGVYWRADPEDMAFWTDATIGDARS